MQSITPAEVHAQDGAYILDVREPSEWAERHVEGAHHIPLGELVARFSELPVDETVYVMCLVGGRSAQATQFLEVQGYEAVNMSGGIDAWQGQGLPVVAGA
ncbi:rhodanese-like domain-containing protein [Agromyces seonyuensis]|uniref:Rhodanese-like domain-containing protein n=1 Tax=Agromyces seonyuensis TaxID=2662446 RepID=A0A6I4P2G8_9MICO|nr:rhodanese-like domain-containing protein [Agromyces seonyuensis]MWB97487.1 rhodanese-like domain-containing protein [Agromyces seonyuensis]